MPSNDIAALIDSGYSVQDALRKAGLYAGYSGIINVKSFGAKGDGSTDDTAAIQAAINSLDGTGTGGIIYFPASTADYIVTSTLTYQQTGLANINPGIMFVGDGRRTSKVKYTGTSGFCLQIKGATGAAISATGRLGLIEGVLLKSISFTGTGKSSGNSDSGVYAQGVQHFALDDALVTDFPNRCVWVNRLYYNLSPDATLDDRGVFLSFINSEISRSGNIGLLCGGLTTSTDYSADHVYTENLQVVDHGDIGAKMYVNNWTDNGSLFYGDSIGLHLYANNTNILTQNVTMIGTRFEGGQSDCMLKIDSLLAGKFLGCFFPGHSGPLPLVQVKIASDASYNVGHITFEGCINQQATTAFDIVGNGTVDSVNIINPRFSSVTNETLNANNKVVRVVKGNIFERVAGGSPQIALEGIAGLVMTSKLDGDSDNWMNLDNSSKQIGLGNGSGAIDTFLKRLTVTSAAAMACTTHFSVQQTQAGMYSGSGTPEGSVAGAVGSTYTRTDGGAGTSFYVKESGGVSNTGWVGK